MWALGFFIFSLNFDLVDLQFCVSFRCTVKGFGYTHIPNTFSDAFPFRLL